MLNPGYPAKSILCAIVLLTLAACADSSAPAAVPLDPAQQYAQDVSNAVAKNTQTIANYAQSGTTDIKVTLAPSGQLLSSSVSKSCGTEGLDNFALQAVENTHFPRLPASLPQQNQTFILPVVFTSHTGY
jgi:TonB family protein